MQPTVATAEWREGGRLMRAVFTTGSCQDGDAELQHVGLNRARNLRRKLGLPPRRFGHHEGVVRLRPDLPLPTKGLHRRKMKAQPSRRYFVVREADGSFAVWEKDLPSGTFALHERSWNADEACLLRDTATYRAEVASFAKDVA